MLTFQEVPKVGNVAAHVVAKIVLSSGVVAGEGKAGTRENAIYLACQDAIDNGHLDAGRGHWRIYGDKPELELNGSPSLGAQA